MGFVCASGTVRRCGTIVASMLAFATPRLAVAMPAMPSDLPAASLLHAAPSARPPLGVDAAGPRRAAPVSGAWKTIVILADFLDYHWDNGHDPYFANSDSAHTYAQSHYQGMLFSDNTYRDPFSASSYTGSMRDFYRENSYSQFSLSGTVTVWVRLPHTYRYYCNTDGILGSADDYGWAKSDSGMVQDLVHDAVLAANPLVDFSQFDNDHNGTVDGLFVVHAGPGAEAIYSSNSLAAPSYVWSHKWTIPSLSVDGVTVSNYSMEPEDGTVGVFCHEFGHVLGLPDLYDVDGTSEGAGEWDVMSSGGWCYRGGDARGTCPSHFSAWSKAFLGWVTPTVVTLPRLAQTITPVESSPAVYRLWTNGSAGNEYFLIENRQAVGFDAGLTRRQFDFTLPAASGLLIWHVDDSMADNTNELHKKLDVVESTPYWTGSVWYEQLDHARTRPNDQYLSNGNRGDNGDPWPGWSGVNATATDYTGTRGKDAFGPGTIPSSNGYSGGVSGVALTHIAISGQNVLADLYTSTPTAAVPPAKTGRATQLDTQGSRVTLTLAQAATSVRVEVYDMRGRRVAVVAEGALNAGPHVWDWARGAHAAGVYVVRASASGMAGTWRASQRAVLSH